MRDAGQIYLSGKRVYQDLRFTSGLPATQAESPAWRGNPLMRSARRRVRLNDIQANRN